MSMTPEEINLAAATIKIDNSYELTEELEKLLRLIDEAHTIFIEGKPEERQKRIENAHHALYCFCKGYAIGLSSKK